MDLLGQAAWSGVAGIDRRREREKELKRCEEKRIDRLNFPYHQQPLENIFFKSIPLKTLSK